VVRVIMISFFFGSRLCPVCVASLRYKAVCRLKANSEHPYPSEEQQQEWADTDKVSRAQIKQFFKTRRRTKRKWKPPLVRRNYSKKRCCHGR
jgi:hypothetical protein